MNNFGMYVVNKRNNNFLLKSKLLIIGLALFTHQFISAAEPAENQQWMAESDQSKFTGTLSLVNGEAKIGQFQQWHLTLINQYGESVFPAQIKIGGGMPSHGHGLPTQPQITEYLGDGTYLIEGLKFNMAGEWIMDFDITSTEDKDKINFKFYINY